MEAISRLRLFFPSRASLGYWTLTFLTYLLTAKLGQFLYTGLDSAPAIVWPPAGISLAAVFLGGLPMTSAIAMAQLVSSVSNGSAWQLVIASTVGFTLQAVIGAYVFRFFDFRPNVSRLRDTLLLIGSSIFLPMVAPTALLLTRLSIGPTVPDPVSLWRIVWSGGILSILIMTPLITSFAQDRRFYRDKFLEHTIAVAAIAMIMYLLFWTKFVMIGSLPLVYLSIVPFFWLAIRFPPRSTALGLFLASLITVCGVVAHPPAAMPLGEALFQTELWLEVVAIIFLIMSSALQDRRIAVEELRANVERLESTVTKISEEDSAKSDFLAILSHELRNPLSPVLSTLELLRIRRAPEDDETPLIEGAEQRLHMMGRLLDDLLDISRISEKRLKLKKEYTNLRDIAQRSVDGALPQMNKFKHTLEVSLPPADLTVFADPIRLEQVFVNILNNAAKYTPAGGKIEFGVQARGDKAIATVRDNGTGIEANMLARIFEPFIQVSNTKYGTSGVGVGLALAKELVEMHDGTISALSAGLGRGSTFVIELPLTQRPVTEPEAAAPTESETPALNILVIDDNQAGTEALGRLLTFRGHKATLAYSGLSGVDIALKERPDAILLDIGLPDIGGYEVARRLRSAGSTAFIIALTGYGQDDDRKMALYAGCDVHLTKPVSLQDIEAALRSRFAI